MYERSLVAVCISTLLNSVASASPAPSIPFVDGFWHGNIETGAHTSTFEECWASTTFDDETTMWLAVRKDGTWYLRLSNPQWRLPHPHRYAMVSLVDVYPRLRSKAETKSQSVLEITDSDHLPLVGQIEIGHTIDLASDGFHEKYDLEGSAKVIERLRNCFRDQSAAKGTTSSGTPAEQ